MLLQLSSCLFLFNFFPTPVTCHLSPFVNVNVNVGPLHLPQRVVSAHTSDFKYISLIPSTCIPHTLHYGLLLCIIFYLYFSHISYRIKPYPLITVNSFNLIFNQVDVNLPYIVFFT